MVRLTEKDSVPRVADATERHIRLCNQTPGGEKYKAAIELHYSDFKEKKAKLDEMQKEVNFAQDIIWLKDGVLDNTLRNIGGRAREYDRNHPGNNTLNLLFPGGGVTSVVTLPDKEEPDAAHSIAQKIIALGEQHELYSFAAKIEEEVAECRTALAQQVTALQNLGDAKTALAISKMALVRQYNANYFTAASDVNKEFAEKLFPRLRPNKRKKNNTEPDIEEENND